MNEKSIMLECHSDFIARFIRHSNSRYLLCLLQPPVPAYAGTEGCYRLLVFIIIFFIKRVIFETADGTLAPNMAGRRAWLGRSCL